MHLRRRQRSGIDTIEYQPGHHQGIHCLFTECSKFNENKTNIIQKLLNWIFNWQISKSDKIHPSQQIANLHYFLIFPPKIGFDSISELVDDLHVMTNTIFWEISEKYFKMSSAASFPSVNGNSSQSLFACLFCCFTFQVNSYGHGGTVSSHNQTFSWASLNKQLTSISCTYFRL